MGCERGQGTIEWLGLVLLVALALGGLARSVRSAPAAPELGEALVERIGWTAAGEAPALLAPLPPVRETRALKAPSARKAAPRAKAPPRPLPPRAVPLPRSLRPRAPSGGLRLPRVPVGDGLRWLRDAARKGANRVWIGCLGYRRFRHALEEGHTSIGRPPPLGESLRSLNTCLNPLDFLAED